MLTEEQKRWIEAYQTLFPRWLIVTGAQVDIFAAGVYAGRPPSDIVAVRLTQEDSVLMRCVTLWIAPAEFGLSFEERFLRLAMSVALDEAEYARHA